MNIYIYIWFEVYRLLKSLPGRENRRAVEVLADQQLVRVGQLPTQNRLVTLQTKSKVVVQSTLLTQSPNRFTRALPPRGSRDPLRLAEGGALPYEGARHCPGFSLC